MAGIALTRSGPEKGGNFEYHWQGEYLQAHLLSDVGKKRAHNEDSCLLCAPEDKQLADNRGYLFAVADGMGGVSGGEFASRLALETLVDQYYSGPKNGTPQKLAAAVEEANRRIYEEAENHPELSGMGTTVSALLVQGDQVYIAHVGDSRVYLCRGDGQIWQLTNDHSLVAEQLRSGYISEEEARNHSLRNLITRAVGTKEAVKVDLFVITVQPEDTLLICSDGLSNLVRNEQIVEAMDNDSLQGIARKLVGFALEEGGQDNITAVMVRVTKTPPKSKRDEGAVELTLDRSNFLTRLKKMIFD